MMGHVVDHTKLSGSHTVYPLIGMHHIAALTHGLDGGCMILRGMPNLERDTLLLQRKRQYMEIVYLERLLVGRLWIVAMTDIEDIGRNILFHH